LRIIGVLAAVLSCLLLTVLAVGKDNHSLESELVSLQSESGQLITQLQQQSIDVLLFGHQDLVSVPLPGALKISKGVISPDGEEIAFQQVVPSRTSSDPKTQRTGYKRILSVVQMDGRNLRQFWHVEEPTEFCWSRDRERLAYVSDVTTEAGIVTAHQLQVLNLKSGKITLIDTAASISSQCWNESGTSFVFGKGGALLIFDAKAEKTMTLATGDDPTWSPDGRSIAFRRSDSYYTIKTSSSAEKLLFQRKGVLTPLWWSPDSDYVSYVAQPSMWKTSWHIPDELDLRIMRLADKKEVVAYRFSAKGRPLGFQWVRNSELFTKARTASHW
jgi:dipeptidyl aminopeptidase/acylaminoacyl peptidase